MADLYLDCHRINQEQLNILDVVDS